MTTKEEPVALRNKLDGLMSRFTDDILGAIKEQILHSLTTLDEVAGKPRRPGRPAAKPKKRAGKKRGPGRPKKSKTMKKVARKPAKKSTRKAAKKPAKKPVKKTTRKPAKKVAQKKRPTPKCVHPGCNENRYPKGGGYCSKHWKAKQAGELG